MVDFTLSEQEQQIRQFTHGVAKNMIRPGSLAWDQAGAIPEDVLVSLAFLRGSTSPGDTAEAKDKSGKSTKNRIAILGAEELAWGDAALLLSLPGPGLGGPPVLSMGTKEQRRRFFAPFSQPGLHWGAYALTEPGAGSDVSAIRTSCRKDGDGWILSGRKCYITNGARADWVVVFATVDPSLGRAGHRAFVIERGTPGFSVGKIEKKLGLRASETAELVLDDVRVGADCLLGGEEHYRGKEGFLGAMQTFDSTRPMVAALAVGIARAAYEYARDFVRDNYMLARPLPHYARLGTTLAECARLIDAARLMCWRAGFLADEGIGNSKEASMAKAYAAQVAMRVCRDAVQIVGAHGLSEDSLLQKWYRDIKVFDIFEGTGQIQRIVISRRILAESPHF